MKRERVLHQEDAREERELNLTELLTMIGKLTTTQVTNQEVATVLLVPSLMMTHMPQTTTMVHLILIPHTVPKMEEGTLPQPTTQA